jgi:hypothetical protein
MVVINNKRLIIISKFHKLIYYKTIYGNKISIEYIIDMDLNFISCLENLFKTNLDKN